jgi:hypothetical protein
MASDVSALSSIVAKSHQTLHLVSPTPSKIPYGGFFPSTASNPLDATATFASACTLAYKPSLFVSPSAALDP